MMRYLGYYYCDVVRLKNRVYLIAILVFFLSIMSHISVGSLFSLIVSWQTLEIVLVLA